MLFDEAGGRRRGRALTVALAALACALAMTAVARAEELMVNSTADKAGASPGVGCSSEEERAKHEEEGVEEAECTLRAAIEKADGLGEFARIDFEEETFEGQVGATIGLNESLPAITVPAFVNGRECKTAGVRGPCVGIDGPSGKAAIVVGPAEEVEISGLAITGAGTAIVLENAPRTKVQGNWFGVKLGGGPGANGTGVLVGPGANRSLIGGEGDELRNVFAGNTGDGLDVRGAANVRVFGNYFGVKPDGVSLAANGGDDVEAVSFEGLEATGTAIGTRVSSAAAASPQCDGGCNVISGAASNGVDLQGDGKPETPAAATAVAGNYIGLNADGTAAIPNTGASVRVGEAAHTAVGGPSAGEVNRINGGSVGVLAGPAASDLSIRGNLVGVDATGASTLAPPAAGIVVDSAELPSPLAEAEIVDNEIRMLGGVAIAQQGQGAWIFANRISGSETGIKTSGATAQYGNVIEANSIDGPAVSGILVENDLNEVVGNEILGAGGAGIWIQGSSLPFGVSGNLIGGDAARAENFIAGSGGAAIEISDLENTENEVARNRGTANQGLFIDLVAASAGEPKGPNEGIAPPGFATSTQAAASGVGAEPGATIRIFRKQLAAAGELDSFLGRTVADAEGSWKVIYDGAIPAGAIVAATQTSNAGGTSELSMATASAVAGGGGEGGEGEGVAAAPGGGGAPGARVRPQTKIVKIPKKRSRSGTARFEFESDEPGSIFLCRLDDKPFDLCRSPKTYKRLKPGKHLFEVRAIDPAGHVDRTPAKTQFTVLD
ncbi:MAG TPA: right-handed parallel beta-helix repeat-containing protein [Solirubrobacterales bacterium]